jgi:hypothetical protein
MSKPLYRARLTMPNGDYRVREFASEKNAIRFAKMQVNNYGATGYIERQVSSRASITGMSITAIWHSDSVEKCRPELAAEAA